MKKQTDICPLMAIACIGSTGAASVCMKDRCAWWDGGCCVIRILAHSLENLEQNGLPVFPN